MEKNGIPNCQSLSEVATIIGTGSYLPSTVLSNSQLEKMVDTTNEWIVARTGIQERRIASKEECTSDMGYHAAINALQSSCIPAEAIDLIIVATSTPDYIFPSTACLIQARLGAKNAAAVDIQAACTGYIYGLSIAKAYVESGMYQTVLLVASEKLSSIVDYTDRNTCILFGDGAAACVVTKNRSGCQISHVVLGADGSQSQLLFLPGGGSKYPATESTVQEKQHFLQMEGREVFKHAVRGMEEAISKCLSGAKLSAKEIRWMIPHQANIRIIDTLSKRFGMSREQVYLTIDKYGNTSASSIGIALDELLKTSGLSHGNRIILSGFGAGLTSGAACLTYSNKGDR